jgi:LacI family transcriptional regulator
MEKLKRKKAPTISDIARIANTSTATVSRVLGDSDYPVSSAIREKVKQIAKEINYSPNLLGRMLKKNETSDIGVIVPTIQNPFYTEVLIGIEMEAKKNGYDILLYNSFRNVKAERRHIKKLCQKQVKGIIISSVDNSPAALTEFLQTGGNVVLFDQDADVSRCIKIKFDFIKASRMAVEYLISMGHVNIAFLSSPLVLKSRKDNLEGYKQALAVHNIDLKPENILISEEELDIENGMYEFENGKGLAKLFILLKERPTAIFAVNDITAFGIIQQLAVNGLSVPDDVSVIGFDNIEISKMVNPPLTTINQPSYETGRMAGKMLIDTLGEKVMDNNFTVSMEPSVVIRKSVRQI